MADYCTGKNVFEASLDRIRQIYDNHDEVVVSMSGGKDSTIVFNLAKIVAKEKNKLPIKVFWLDQECEWQATVDYMDSIMRDPDVTPYWYQIPLDFTNSTSHKNNFMHIWDKKDESKWCHPQSDISIKENPTNKNRFHDVMNGIHKYLFEESTTNGCILMGIRAEENIARAKAVKGAQRTGEGKYNKANKSTKAFPIWDWSFSDVWVAIAKNKWAYNKIYDYQYQYGYATTKMRVSALIHETAWQNIKLLQEAEPKTYERFVRRIDGVATQNHMFDQNCESVPDELPYMFRDWKEYRDYLLVHLVKKEYWDLFRKRWIGQDGDIWYKLHVKEVIINDIDGTINQNKAIRFGLVNEMGDKYKDQDREKLKEYLERNGQLDD